MDDERTPIQRFSGHLVLLVVGFLLFLGGRTHLINRLFAFEGLPTPVAAGESQASPPPTPIGETAAATSFDLSQLPAPVDSSLAPAPTPHTYQGKLPQHNFQTYVVEPGDTPNRIAEKFNIEPETILGGNPLLSQESSLLQAGVELIILPINGVLHDVEEGDTLESVSAQYGIPVEEIIAYAPNNLEFPYRLYPGTQILVPGAVRQVFVWTAPQLPSRPSLGGNVAALVVGTGTFVWPVSGRSISQYYWYGHAAIDIALPEGSAVVASDTGTVTYAGWNVYGYGNLIVINHGNGFETYYAHLSSINVFPGQVVYQGNYIGATGNTGFSSGPHIHFEIRYFNVQYDPLSGYLP
ncbi:MAG: LysM peptidoglycan-binding domain-containing M23 family metallopeptidase [Chloroflexota bacterium]